jgi:hypothetical protein
MTRSSYRFSDGMLLSRMEALFEGKSHAATLFGGPHYFAEQLGYRNAQRPSPLGMVTRG